MERLGQEAPTGRQMLILRFLSLVQPPPGASIALRLRGFALILLILVTLITIGFGIVELVSLPFGGAPGGIGGAVVVGIIVVVAVIGALAWWGRRRQARARASAGAGA